MLSYIVKGEMLLVSFLSQKDSDFRFYPKEIFSFFSMLWDLFVLAIVCPYPVYGNLAVVTTVLGHNIA